MRMGKFLVCAGLFIAVCVWCFNYTEGHQSTLRKQTIKEYKGELNRVSKAHGVLADKYNDLKWKFGQACDLLTAAEVENDLCPEKEEIDEETTENSDE